jgi:aspartyl-tRNA(Asn)/glutamyl-tRNA(Gln) amidotransferase subunit B
VVDETRRQALAAAMPELPWERYRRLLGRYQLDSEEVRQLAGDPALARYFESAARATGAFQQLAGWLLGEVKGELGRRGGSLDAAPPPKRLGELVELVADGTLSRRAAKQVLAATWESDEAPAAATERLGLARVADRRQLQRWAAEVVQQHPEEVAQYRRGKEKLLAFFTGRLMALSQGRADPRGAQAALRRELAEAELNPAEPRDEPAAATCRAHAADEVS